MDGPPPIRDMLQDFGAYNEIEPVLSKDPRQVFDPANHVDPRPFKDVDSEIARRTKRFDDRPQRPVDIHGPYLDHGSAPDIFFPEFGCAKIDAGFIAHIIPEETVSL